MDEQASKAEIEKLRKAAGAGLKLAAKLDEIANHHSFQAQAGLAFVHGMEYDGPTWQAEREAVLTACAEAGVALGADHG